MENEDIKRAASAFGKMGGKANAEKHDSKHFSDIGKMGAASRWGKKEEPKDREEPGLDKKPE